MLVLCFYIYIYILRRFCSRCSSINCLDFGKSTDISLNIYIPTFKFCFSVFVVSVLLAGALGLGLKYPSVLFTLELLKNLSWRKLFSTPWLVVKFPESSAFLKIMQLVTSNVPVKHF